MAVYFYTSGFIHDFSISPDHKRYLCSVGYDDLSCLLELYNEFVMRASGSNVGVNIEAPKRSV